MRDNEDGIVKLGEDRSEQEVETVREDSKTKFFEWRQEYLDFIDTKYRYEIAYCNYRANELDISSRYFGGCRYENVINKTESIGEGEEEFPIYGESWYHVWTNNAIDIHTRERFVPNSTSDKLYTKLQKMADQLKEAYEVYQREKLAEENDENKKRRLKN